MLQYERLFGRLLDASETITTEVVLGAIPTVPIEFAVFAPIAPVGVAMCAYFGRHGCLGNHHNEVVAPLT